MLLKKRVIARIGFKPEREGVPDDWDDPNRFVDENVEGHSGEKNFWKTAAHGGQQRHGRNHRRPGVAEAGNESQQRIEAEAEIRPWETKEVIHDEREPAEERLELGAPLF